MKSAPVNLDAKQFLQPYIAEMDLSAEMIQQRKLARFVRGFEHQRFEPEHLDKAVGVCGVQFSVLVKEADSFRTLSAFDNELYSCRIEPLLSVGAPYRKGRLVETAVMLIALLDLTIESAALCRAESPL